MNIKRIIKHLSFGNSMLRKSFPRTTLEKIENVIAKVEKTHTGQIRFAVEAALDIKPLFAGLAARARAVEVFSILRIWDTEHNNGVLIYLLLADRKVEIIADRGVHHKLGQEIWETICREMENSFRQGQFEEGVIAGIQSVGKHLEQNYPHIGSKINELSDQPVIL
jgi:uncharacterized membrane protein